MIAIRPPPPAPLVRFWLVTPFPPMAPSEPPPERLPTSRKIEPPEPPPPKYGSTLTSPFPPFARSVPSMVQNAAVILARPPPLPPGELQFVAPPPPAPSRC